MLSIITALKWKLIPLCALSALAGSAITITITNIIKVNEPVPIECLRPINDTFNQKRPTSSGHDKEY